MIDQVNILILSGFLFFIGFLGILKQPNFIKTFISLEIIIMAGIVNFSYFSGKDQILVGHFAILLGVILGTLVLSVSFIVLYMQYRSMKFLNILNQNIDEKIIDD